MYIANFKEIFVYNILKDMKIVTIFTKIVNKENKTCNYDNNRKYQFKLY
jgi:hypothetical protein